MLDFGLTKLVEAECLGGADAPTAVGELTEIGQVVGTVPYMSPEQAKGMAVDHRSDIFSLGVVLYEMLAGKRPFLGDTKAEAISSILRDDPPPLEERRLTLPARLARVVERCLEKDRERRYQSAIDMRNDLEELRHEHESGALVGLPVRRPTLSRRDAAWMAASVATLILALVLFWLDTRWRGSEKSVVADTSTADLVRTQLSYDHRQITFNGRSSLPRISGDGDLVALEDSEDPDAVPLIRIHDLRTDQTLVIGERQGLGTMRWSPDDGHLLLAWHDPEWVASIVPRFGGEDKPLPGVLPYAAWSPEGDRLVHTSQASKGLMLVDLATLQETFVPLEGTFQWIWDLDWSFDTGRIAVLADVGEGKDERILMIVDPEQGVVSTPASPRTLEQIRWGSAGRRLYFLDSHELVRSDVSEESDGLLSLERVMPGVPVVSFSLSRDGTRIAYARLTTRANLWTLDLASEGASAQPLTRGTSQDTHPALSPDGRHVAFTRLRGDTAQIVVLDLETDQTHDLTALPGDHDFARWSPDGGRLAFFSTHDGPRQLWSIPAQAGRARRLHDGASINGGFDWSPDDLRLAYVASDARTLVVLDSSNGEVLDSTVAPFGWILAPRFAPDGDRLAVHLHYGGGRFSFWTYRLDGGEGGWQWVFGHRPPAQLPQLAEVADLEGVGLLRWSEDGHGLVLQRGNGLYRALLGTATLEPIADIPSEYSTRADLSADGRVLVYSETVTSTDVWIAERPPGER